MGGMGSIILHALHTNGVDFKAKTLGIRGEFGQSAYKAEQLYARFDLSAAGIVKAYKEF
jgi:transketolase